MIKYRTCCVSIIFASIFIYICFLLPCIFRNDEIIYSANNEQFPYLPVLLGEQVINIRASLVPMVLSSLSKDIKNLPKEELGSLEGLLNWTKPFKTDYGFSAKSFSIFLPPRETIRLNETWWIVESQIDSFVGLKSSVRHSPPKVNSKFHPLVSLLSLFHPKPFLWTRFGPQGTCATLRAIGPNYYDIVFRMHAEFQLNDPPFHPFWFTPSQFQGRLIINKDASVIHYFEMQVPDKKLNVDMEWLNGPSEDSMEVDIGHIPQMSLLSTAISAPSEDSLGSNEDLVNIKWDYQIAEEEAYNLLDKSFYKFKKVKYYNLTEAFRLAEQEQKLVHGIVLWGNLDDQSC